MPAPDNIILEILNRNTVNGDTDPLAATADLALEYSHHLEWFDRNKCASTDIRDYKNRHSFKVDLAWEPEQSEFSIVVLGDGKERKWSFRKYMTEKKILQRIALIQKKDIEHHEAVLAEVAYWKMQL
jgi:hypothetical protein